MLHAFPPPLPPLPSKPSTAIDLSSIQTFTGISGEDDDGDDVREDGDPQSRAATESTIPEKPQRVVFGTWILGNTIGAGSSGSVKLVIHRDTQKKCVVKSIKREDTKYVGALTRNRDGIALREHFMLREALVGIALDHPNIIRMHSYVIGRNHFYFFYEYLEGVDLSEYIAEKGKMSENDAKPIFKQIFSAVGMISLCNLIPTFLAIAYLHNCHIIHRDLKLENIRINPATKKIHVLDFGFSTFFSPKFKQHSACGSPSYASPEIYSHAPYRGPEVDIWSLGVCLYGCITGRLPFESDAFEILSELVIRGQFHMPMEISILRLPIQETLAHGWVLDRDCIDGFFYREADDQNPGYAYRRNRAKFQTFAELHYSQKHSLFDRLFHLHGKGATSSAERKQPAPESSSTNNNCLPPTGGVPPGFTIEWVDRVLRMDRHTRAEFMMRELERRVPQRRWILEREWHAAAGLPQPALPASQAISAPSNHNRSVSKLSTAAMPPPRRKRPLELLARVFRKPAGNSNAPQTQPSGDAAMHQPWSARMLLPLSMASKWNVVRPHAARDSTDDHKTETAFVRMIRKWSTVPAFVADQIPSQQQQPTAAPLQILQSLNSDVTICPADDTPQEPLSPAAETKPPKLPLPQENKLPPGIRGWWRKRFEVEGSVKIRRTALLLRTKARKAAPPAGEEDDGDNVSFEGIEMAQTMR
ncbi:serine/threonine-protein kinase KIN2, partial [Entophlyctis luteolus]